MWPHIVAIHVMLGQEKNEAAHCNQPNKIIVANNNNVLM